MTDNLSATLAVLTALITPALLVSACGTFILATSNRLGRVVDRVRLVSQQYDELVHADPRPDFFLERRGMMLNQLHTLTHRARVLQHALTTFYSAASVFLFTSVALGLEAFIHMLYYWLPVMFGMSGVCLLFAGCVMLILEARIAVRTLAAETDFLIGLARRYAGERDASLGGL